MRQATRIDRIAPTNRKGSRTIDRWQSYLFGEHSRAELRDWARRLRLFRYCRAIGGHANDYDELVAAFSVPTRTDLMVAASELGITLNPIPVASPGPSPDRGPWVGAPARTHSPIDRAPDLAQPGPVLLAGVELFAWVRGGLLFLSISSGPEGASLTDQDVANAERIETWLEGRNLSVVDPPRKSRHCVCPQHYPELWHD